MMIVFFRSNLLLSAQHGLFKGRSTVTNLIKFTSYVLNCMENDVQVEAIYTDLTRSQYILLRKLAKLGLGGSFLAWIRFYLNGRKQFVNVSGSQSRRISVRSDVPQGSHLGPLLLILFINDVFSCFK
jgi:hypothetical protein